VDLVVPGPPALGPALSLLSLQILRLLLGSGTDRGLNNLISQRTTPNSRKPHHNLQKLIRHLDLAHLLASRYFVAQVVHVYIR
jgi:hypothetical protein